jgi:hypothetical protein
MSDLAASGDDESTPATDEQGPPPLAESTTVSHVPATLDEAGDGAIATKSADELLAGANPVVKAPYRDRKREHKLLQQIEEHNLRKRVAKYAYIATAAQIVVADGVFVIYAWVGMSWEVPTPAIAAWLSATVVQVIAVLLVITRYLFPDGGRKRRNRPQDPT